MKAQLANQDIPTGAIEYNVHTYSEVTTDAEGLRGRREQGVGNGGGLHLLGRNGSLLRRLFDTKLKAQVTQTLPVLSTQSNTHHYTDKCSKDRK